MERYQTAVGVFADHDSAEKAVKTLNASGFDIKHLSVVGNGYHSEEKVVGFYNIGDRIRFWGVRGAFWGGFWGLFLGGLFITTPVGGPVFIVGFLASIAIAAIENAVVVGALGALGGALYSIGIPKDSVLQYESDIKADSFLVAARGSEAEVARAKNLLANSNAARVEVHSNVDARDLAPATVPAAA